MAYSSLSIKQLITDITDNKYFLPAIQRKFVWREEKICMLFNSIMRDYPIGTFLFWELSAKKANNYTFYEFLKNYHERDSKNKLVRYDFPRDIIGVLDGQQRISSMYIALQGVFCTKRKHAKRSNDRAYPERKFYMNLLGSEDNYEFKFLSDKAAFSADGRLYYLVRNILTESEDADPDEIIDDLKKKSPNKSELIESNRHIIRKNLNKLLKKFNDSHLVSYFRVVNKDLDEILDIFVRVNSGGTILSKSDLLFSTLVAHWEDGREQIEQLIETMNGEDGVFDFNTDFLMRTCLFLVDAPMSFKVQSFDRNNISKIKDNWEKIVKALTETSFLLRKFGFNKSRLTSNYAATPLAYYIYKGGIVNRGTSVELRKLITHSLLKQVFSGQSDTVLRGLRDGLRVQSEGGYCLKEKFFNFDNYKETKLSGGKRLTIDSDDIDEFLKYKKGPFCFLLLSILYPDLKLDQIVFHQDHMHPYSGFKSHYLSKLGLEQEVIKLWQHKRDQLPNLQLLEGQENTQKQATPLESWVENMVEDELYFRKRNYVPDQQSLSFTDFEQFFEARKTMIRNKLLKEFKVKESQTLHRGNFVKEIQPS